MATLSYQNLDEQCSYTIELVENKSYTLQLTNLKLKLYETGVGIISLFCENREYVEYEDIQKINEYGRRIYPQFIDKDGGISETKKAFLANKLTLKLGDKTYTDNFDKRELKSTLFTKLLSDESIQSVIDDRMFVMCHYMNNSFAEQLTSFDETKEEYHYETSAEWYRYLFIDGNSLTCQNRNMLKKLISEKTYGRWADYATIYGLSAYSFMLLTNDSDYSIDVLSQHLEKQYYEMMSIVLMQHASILKFSNDVTKISAKNDKEIATNMTKLYKKYIRFTNRLFYRDVTAQEQGIELFNLAQKNISIKENVKDLDNEIEELHRLTMLIEDKESSKRIEILNILGALLLPATLVVGFFGMNVPMITGKDAFFNSDKISISILIFTIIISAFILFYGKRNHEK